MSNSSLIPVPDAEISAWISSLRNILSMRDRSTLRILPRIGRIAWKLRFARLLRAAAGAVTLDDEQLGLFGVAGRAVGELARHQRGLEQRLAPREVAGLAGGHRARRGLRRLRDDRLGLVRVLLEPLRELLVRGLLDERPDLGVAELGLGLAFELRVAQLHRDDRGESLADVLAEEVLVLLLEMALARGRNG